MLTSTTESFPFRSRSRQPAVVVAVCFAAGILLDRFVSVLTWGRWSLLAGIAVGFAIWGWRRLQVRIVAASLLAAGVCLGGIRHHAFWSLSSRRMLSRFVGMESRLVRLRGRVAEPPFIKPPSQLPFQSVLPQSELTIFSLNCGSLRDGKRLVPIRGKVQVRVNGLLADLKAGDGLEVFGLDLPTLPAREPRRFCILGIR